MGSPDVLRPDAAATLVLEHISKAFRRPVLRSLDLEVRSGEVLVLLGTNGAGKTTLFEIIMGLLPADGGSVVLASPDGTIELQRLSTPARAQAGVGYLPQEPSVFRGLTVEQNILVALESGSRLARRDRQSRAESVMETLGISALAHQRCSTLSGGERRRTELARLLALDPVVILADEPFAGVDGPTVEVLVRVFRERANQGAAVVLTDHRIPLVRRIADRVALLSDGCITRTGTPSELFRDEPLFAYSLDE